MIKRKLQSVHFRSIDEFLDFLPEKELVVVELLRKIVLNCLPNCIEKLSYNVPYYSIHKRICFIWPASITWGNKVTYTGVRFGFAYGYLMHDDHNYLNKGNRKQVYWRDFITIKDIDIELLKSYIFEAALIDEQHQKSK